jgi:hypothetical protein
VIQLRLAPPVLNLEVDLAELAPLKGMVPPQAVVQAVRGLGAGMAMVLEAEVEAGLAAVGTELVVEVLEQD